LPGRWPGTAVDENFLYFVGSVLPQFIIYVHKIVIQGTTN
jgi:hypothetical protein